MEGGARAPPSFCLLKRRNGSPLFGMGGSAGSKKMTKSPNRDFLNMELRNSGRKAEEEWMG